jgi:hypothetical protein
VTESVRANGTVTVRTLQVLRAGQSGRFTG